MCLESLQSRRSKLSEHEKHKSSNPVYGTIEIEVQINLTAPSTNARGQSGRSTRQYFQALYEVDDGRIFQS